VRYTLLAGGVGAARLLRGLVRTLPPQDLDVIVNTGDDEEFYGLHVSPDLDTITYTLAGVATDWPGWGLRGETFAARAELDRLYGQGWFGLGDRDLATHLFRTEHLRKGRSLSWVTRAIAASYDLSTRVRPMSDDRVRTLIDTTQGTLDFQEYLVKRRGKPRVTGVRFKGARRAKPAPGVLTSLKKSSRIFIAPSNPFVSIGPMMAMPELRRALVDARHKTVAVSPLIGGRAIKGPLAQMLRSQGHKVGTQGIAEIYKGLASVLVVAPGDTPKKLDPSWPRIVEAPILINTPARSLRLAKRLVGMEL
jgi:LPPG:FO 2-phospho-L-lactate transferase